MKEKIKKLFDKLYWWFMNLDVILPGEPGWDEKHPYLESVLTLISSLVGVWLAFKFLF